MLRERFAGSPSVEIVNGDATQLDFADGTFTGAACFTMLHHVPTVELQDRLFAEVARVLRPGAALVASDSLGSDELAVAHEGDTYNPVDPASLLSCDSKPGLLRPGAGFRVCTKRTLDERDDVGKANICGRISKQRVKPLGAEVRYKSIVKSKGHVGG